MTTPADELRAAVAKLRALATAAGGESWIADHYEQGTIVHPANSMRSLFRLAADGMRAAGTPHVTAPVGDWIAAMHPGVGEKLARWLETEASTWAGDEVHYRCSAQTCTLDAALAMARAINGGQS
ncbi:hypothetical protein ACFZAR_05455 [Streptomyces sp. NPDC008222]|uniref:hypothetical protein n=1 Tax=Streptomyces sp. NPDC008222 TaxID=3364820 RepID=UPI0036DFD341